MSGHVHPRRPASGSAIPRRVLEDRRSVADPALRPLTSFIGRERELATVVDLLGRPDVRLLTITGPGGVGKTRLALRATDAIQGSFTDGAIVVSLAAVRDPALVLPTVAHHLDVPDAPDQPLLARLQGALAEAHLLLVLDNAEHVVEAMPFVVDLLASCPRLTILVTSRIQLNLSGERLIPLVPLPPGEARALFAERAGALAPGFTLTDELGPVVDRIVARLDGLPLAIELAASRVPALPPRAILARLDHRLDLLTSGPRDAPARLRGMRDAIGWSHDLLPGAQQLLFRHLGVFIGGFTLEATEAVAGDEIDVLDGIATLVAASLIMPIQGVADEPRYTMLETIREYALERLGAAGEEAEARARHAGYYCRLAESALPLYDGPDIRIATDRIDIELDNCRAAMTWALETGDAETGTRLAGALWRVWWYALATGGRAWTERVQEGRAWLDRMLALDQELPVEAVTEALAGASALAHLRGDLDRAQALGDTLLSRTADYPYGLFWARIVLGQTAEERGDVETARRHYAEGLAIAPAVRNPQNHRALAHGRFGMLAQRVGDLAEAERHLEEALRLSEITGNAWAVAHSSRLLGQIVQNRGDLGRAAMLARTSLTAHMSQRDVCGVHATLTDGARLALAIGQPERAARLLGAATTFPTHPSEADAFDRATRDAQAGTSGAAFAAASDAGRRLDWDAVVAEIDALVDAATSTPPTTPPDPASRYDLSRRELEVLRYLAEGDSNRAIADTLSLSERTIENHVSSILAKLEVTSRAAAATFAVRHDLI